MTSADHLQVPRQHGLFNHHGIDLGDGTVAHYLEGKKILRSSIEEFSNGEAIKIIHHKNPLSQRITIRRAMSRLGEQNYNLLFNNCEHFANWCKTGYHKSPQIEKLLNASYLGSKKIIDLIPKSMFFVVNLFALKGEVETKKLERLAIDLERLKLQLEASLEALLRRLENAIYTEKDSNINSAKNSIIKRLLMRGQLISDQINLLEDLEGKVSDFFKRKKYGQ